MLLRPRKGGTEGQCDAPGRRTLPEQNLHLIGAIELPFDRAAVFLRDHEILVIVIESPGELPLPRLAGIQVFPDEIAAEIRTGLFCDIEHSCGAHRPAERCR